MRSSSADPAELRRFGLDDYAGIGGVRASSWAVEDGLARYRRACPDHPLPGGSHLVEAVHRWVQRAADTAAWVMEVAEDFALADLAGGQVRPAGLAEAVWVFEAHTATFDTARDTVRGRVGGGDGFVSTEDLWAVAMSGRYPPGLAEAARLLLILAAVDDEVRAAFTPPSAWDRFGGWVHLGLDLGGMVPVAGDLADIANAVIFTAEGKRYDALISLAAAVGAGQVASTGRAVRTAALARREAGAPRVLREALSGAVAANDAYQVVDGTLDGDWKRVLGGGLPLGRSLRNRTARVVVMGGSTRLAVEAALTPRPASAAARLDTGVVGAPASAVQRRSAAQAYGRPLAVEDGRPARPGERVQRARRG